MLVLLFVPACRALETTNDINTPAAYYPNSNTTHTVMRNCEFMSNSSMSMRVGTAYPGTYQDCIGGPFAFGGNVGGIVGTFQNSPRLASRMSMSSRSEWDSSAARRTPPTCTI